MPLDFAPKLTKPLKRPLTLPETPILPTAKESFSDTLNRQISEHKNRKKTKQQLVKLQILEMKNISQVCVKATCFILPKKEKQIVYLSTSLSKVNFDSLNVIASHPVNIGNYKVYYNFHDNAYLK